MNANNSHVLCVSARQHYWRGCAGFSVKRFSRGQAFYEIGNTRRRVDDQHFLVVNAGQEYAVEIDTRHPTTSHCIFFGNELMGEVLAGRPKTGEQDLDGSNTNQSFEFSPHLRSLSRELRLQFEQFETAITRNDSSPLLQEEMFQRFASILVAQLDDDGSGSLRHLALKRSTQDELFRRVSLGHDFIISHWEEPISLRQIGLAACLSPSHLLRSFRAVFGCSPGLYQQRLRMQYAARMFQDPEIRITDVAMYCGYNSLPSFSRLFRRHFGVSPQVFQKKVRSDKHYQVCSITMPGNCTDK